VILGWTVLQPSARERRLWLAAVAATAASAGVLVVAALLADPRYPVRVRGAALVSAAAAAWALSNARPSSGRSREVRIDAEGSIWMRTQPAAGDSECKSRSVFVAPWLITLRCGAMLIAAWPDSLPSDAFRRLHPCARWSVSTANASQSAVPGNPIDPQR
jgi:pimeloyl-ACP methyl ester carboxylesterase